YERPLDPDEVIALVGLEDKRDARVKTLSGGQKRRLDLGVALVGDPELVFLDEPTTGFDPAARRGAWEMIRGLQSLGKTIFLTTHYMDEAQSLADRVAIIRRGQIVAEGPPATLIGREPASLVRFRLPKADAAAVLGDIEGARQLPDGYVSIESTSPTALLYELTRRAHERGLELEDLTVTRPTLEDVYLRLVEEPESEAAP
ncbi:MAG TPA: ABC transporter ATP-binding protein, partial [Dehalococcoidia bacterium]|nr:ABC transporter ATP-binding protein [Dehalococcoidia bacterium]